MTHKAACAGECVPVRLWVPGEKKKERSTRVKGIIVQDTGAILGYAPRGKG